MKIGRFLNTDYFYFLYFWFNWKSEWCSNLWSIIFWSHLELTINLANAWGANNALWLKKYIFWIIRMKITYCYTKDSTAKHVRGPKVYSCLTMALKSLNKWWNQQSVNSGFTRGFKEELWLLLKTEWWRNIELYNITF